MLRRYRYLFIMCFFSAVFFLAVQTQAQGGTPVNISLISIGYDGTFADGDSTRSVVSADGQVVAFESEAYNLVPNYTNKNAWVNIFAYDRQSNQTKLISAAMGGASANCDSRNPSISPDGRFIAFRSCASTLVPNHGDVKWDAFVYDRQTGRMACVSVAPDGGIGNHDTATPAISADGRFVAFYSYASNLVPGDTNGKYDIFLRDRDTDQDGILDEPGAAETIAINLTNNSTAISGIVEPPGISADGRFVAFYSHVATLVPGDTNAINDVFVYDHLTKQITRVSVASDGIQANSGSYHPLISADGRFVAFYSYASNLVAGDTNNATDMFVHDRQTGQTVRLTGRSDGTQPKYNEEPLYPAFSANMQFMAFSSSVSTLVPGDTNETLDVFIHDRDADRDGNLDEPGAIETIRVSVASDGTQANDGSGMGGISDNGQVVVFSSSATNLVPGGTPAYRSNIFLVENPLPLTPLVKTDLVVSQSVSNPVVQELDEVTYTITVTNQGAQNATGVAVHDVLPSQATLVETSPAQYSCSQQGGKLICAIGNLVAGSSVQLNVKVQFSLGGVGSQSNQVTVWLNEYDTNTWTNTNSLALNLNSAPNNLSASIAQDDTINLTWTDNTTQETGFNVERSSDGGATWVEIGSVAQNAQSYTDTPPICETAYAYRVRALLSDGRYTRYSTVATVTTATCPPLPAPTLLTTTVITDRQINVHWTETAADETGFSIERSLDGVAGWVEIGVTHANIADYQDTAVTCGDSYYYRVRAHRSSNNAYSPYSNIAHAATPLCPLPTPTDLTLKAISNSQIAVRWTDTVRDETAFYIERSLDGITGWTIVGQNAANTPLFVDNLLVCTTRYAYRVRAYRASDQAYSAYSNTAQTHTLACSDDIAAPERNNFNTKKVTLTWEAVTWAQGYEVQISNSKEFAGTYNHLQSVAADTLFWTTPELENDTYYWRVHAQIAPGRWSAWSAVESFVIAAP